VAKVRLGAVPYLNARPLIPFGPQNEAEVVFGVPQQLGRWLEEGTIDAGTVPTFFHLIHPERPIIDGIAIASHRRVESVNFFLRRKGGELRTVAVDEGSMTSVALLKVVLRHGYQVDPEFVPRPPDLETMMAGADGALLIGDKGMKAAKSGAYPFLDMGEEWRKLTGLPFVWALWICRDEEAAERVRPVAQKAKEAGLRNLEALAREAAPAVGLDEEDCFRYLSKTIHYDLGPEEKAGIEEFGRLWRELQ